MTFGILDDTRLEHVPGTAQLQIGTTVQAEHSSNLKKGTGKSSNVILVPQPSDSPDDPLNWPLWQRDSIFLLLCYCTILATGGVGPLLSASAVILVEDFHIDFTKVSLLTGYNLCAVGACGIFISAFAHKYGKRPVILFSVSCAFAGTLWGGAANSYNSLVGARILQGFGVAMFESIMFSVVGDLYFVHERGARMAFLTVSTSGLANLPAMISGVITQNLGWRWMFWLLAIFWGIAWVGVIFFGWETAYNRDAIYNVDTSSVDVSYMPSIILFLINNPWQPSDIYSGKNLEIMQDLKEHEVVAHQEDVSQNAVPPSGAPIRPLQGRKAFVKRLAILSGTYSNENLLKMLVRPFAILANPAVVWSTITISIPTTWAVVTTFVIAQIFSAPPFLLDSAKIGYLSAGPVIGGTIACLICGVITDPLTRWLCQKNNGTYEPEFRLILIFPFFVFTVLGHFLFGNLIEGGSSAVVCAVVWAIIVAALQFCFVAVGAYMVDAYRDMAVEVFIIGMVVKNFLFFGFSYFMNDWITAWGPAKVFDCIGGIQIGICLLAVPMWIYGKKLRAYAHEHDILKRLK